jgi:hypothetical protein
MTKPRSLVGQDPRRVLPHRPTKLLVDEFLWHEPEVGIVASYTPRERDVEDHFGVFRGVDQVESFGQACVVSCSVFLDAAKMALDYDAYYAQRNFVFAGVERVHCHGFIRLGEPYVCLGAIEQYKFRQMTVSGRIYKVAGDVDLRAYFAGFTAERLRAFDLDERFEKVFEIHNIIGKGIKNEKFNISYPVRH